jgi:DNA polymerase III delta prime subunit
MKILLNYTNFINEAFLQKDKEKAIDLILQYIKKKTQVDLYPYDELWNIQKGDLFLTGQLFLSLTSEKALRFNWINNDLRSEIHSIDIWDRFDFDTNPNWTLELNENSVVQALPEIVQFWNNPKSLVQTQKELVTNEDFDADDYDPKQRLEDEEKKLSRLRNPEKIEIQKRTIERLKAAIAETERSSTESEKITQLDDDFQIDVFKMIELYTIQVARGKSNSLIISGDPGVGKTQTVKDTLLSLGLSKDIDYYFATGTATTAGLYELLFKNRNRLLVFDDCDAVFKDPESANILKGALDTYDVREISKLTKGNTFDSAGMSEEEIEDQSNTSGKLPNRFDFTGHIIFISNLPESKFDKALLSRSLHVDVHLNKVELFERMKNIMKKLAPDVEQEQKQEALDYLTYICNTYPTKFDLNIRTLIHSINLRAHNEELIRVGDQEVPVWKLLIKKYLVKSR